MSSTNNRRQPPGGDCHEALLQFGGDDDFPESVPHHRITRPPGGESSDIFGRSPNSTPTTPRKVKNYMASNIFTPIHESQQVKARNRPDGDSFNRLFGAKDASTAVLSSTGSSPTGSNGDLTDGQMTPTRTKNYQKSNVLFAEAEVKIAVNGHSTNNGHYNGSGSLSSGSGPNSGSSTPSNGSINGDYKPAPTNGHANGVVMPTTPSKRIPPGGYSTKLW